MQEAVAFSAKTQPANGNAEAEPVGSADSKAKRLNPIKRKQMEDRVRELEAEINRLEDAIADCEASLQTFVSAEETQRLTEELAGRKVELQSRLAEWEGLGQALQT